MTAFKSVLWINIKRRCTDGFAVGYNIIFPLLMIWILGLLSKGIFQQEMVTGYQYYGVVFIPFSIFLSIITAAYAGKDDAYANTAERVLLTPVSISSIVISKVIAEVIVFTGCSVFAAVFVMRIWKVWDISQLMLIVLLYSAISFMIAALGTYIGLGMKDFLKLKNLLNMPIAVFALLAGCFFRWGTLNKRLQFIIDISPLTWINRSIFRMMFDHSSSLLYLLCAVFVMIGLLFTVLAIFFFKKEEYGNGDIPGYEK